MKLQAESTRAGFKRPRAWVLVFGWSLAVCAGLVNVVSFRSWVLFVSHMTGDTTAIGIRIEGVQHRGTDPSLLANSVSLLCSFLLGAFACGMLIDKNQVHFGGKSFYGLALVGNAALLVVATFLTNESDVPSAKTQILPACFAACAAGLQNAMCTSHFGAIVRTTHVTGTLTDIGSTLGRISMIFLRKGCRRSHLNVLEIAEVGVDARKLLVLLPMWLSFLVGTILGAYLHSAFGVKALLIPAFLTFSAGFVYALFRQTLIGCVKKLERDSLNTDLHDMHGTLQRAQSVLKEFNKVRQSNRMVVQGDRTDDVQDETLVIELEEELEDMLEGLHDVEEGIESI